MTKSRNTETRFCKESQLVAPVARFARRKGFRLQAVELQFYEHRIDLYGFSLRKNETVAIELKLTKWRRALEQALLYQLCSDLVYIAMPERSARKVDMAELKNRGIGLITVSDSGSCSCVLPAGEHNEVREFYRSTQINYLRSLSCA